MSWGKGEKRLQNQSSHPHMTSSPLKSRVSNGNKENSSSSLSQSHIKSEKSRVKTVTSNLERQKELLYNVDAKKFKEYIKEKEVTEKALAKRCLQG